MSTKSFSLHFTLAVYAEASCSLDPQTLQLGQEGSGVQLKGLWSKLSPPPNKIGKNKCEGFSTVH